MVVRLFTFLIVRGGFTAALHVQLTTFSPSGEAPLATAEPQAESTQFCNGTVPMRCRIACPAPDCGAGRCIIISVVRKYALVDAVALCQMYL